MYASLSKPWQLCIDLAWEAYCAGSLPIAAVITDGRGGILSVGRNRTRETTVEPPYIASSRLAHAEVNALLALEEGKANRRECILYTTTEPCPLCMGAARMMSIGEIRYASRDPWAGCAAMVEQVPYFARKPITMSFLENADLESCLIALQFDRLLREGERLAHLFSVWEETLPKGTKLGRGLFEEETLTTLVAQKVSAQEALELMSKLS